jgi:hypothetical protein
MRMFTFTSFVFAAAAALAACGSSSIAEDTCKRADECNALRGSVKECVEDINNILDHATQTDRDEAELQMNQCLDHPACSAFLSCFANINGSSSTSSGGGGGGPGDPPPPPPPPAPAP